MRCLLLICVPLLAADSELFETKIRPVLAANCYACHSGVVKQPMAGIRLDNREAFLAANLVVAGKPAESRLYRSLTYDHRIKMPPSGKLDSASLEAFARWIEQGALYPESTVQAGGFWAFTPPTKPLKKPLLTSSAKPLDKPALLRRVTYDLTGLPPTPAELQAFLQDSSPDAYARVVDRLLASPHYGERWARHWMDLVRYAETNGHEYDNDKPAPWHYRDYLIRAFNRDLPYNQLVREHIAGDLLPQPRLSDDGSTLESPLATAFYFFGEVLNSSTDPVKTRADEVDNQIDVLGKAFNGLTIACARCHDHKFDPIPTAEYYGLAGIFHSTQLHEVGLDSPARRREIELAGQGGVLTPAASRVAYREGDTPFASFATTFEGWRKEGAAFAEAPVDGAASSLAAGAPEFVGTLTSPEIDMTDQHYLHIRLSGTQVEGKVNENTPLRLSLVCGGYKARHVVPTGMEPKWITLSLVLERKRRCYVELVDHSTTGFLTVDEIVFSDHANPPATTGGQVRQGPLLSLKLPPSQFGMVAGEGVGKDVAVHLRGNHQQLGAIAPRQYLSALAGKTQPAIKNGSGRLELADRLASEANPLTARVMVNRIWKHHFGQGLVKSTDNFGVMGERPQDQALLDALAWQFIDSGWSIKALHRQLVLSELYRSEAVPARRLEAEAVRDALLAVSGRLDPTLYGPSITPHISPFQNGRGRPVSGPLDGEGRRSIYIQIRRNFIPPLFTAFDYPPPASTIGNRGSSAVPSQALILLNNEFVHQQAKVFAESVLARSTAFDSRLEDLYLRAFCRKPDAAEAARIASYLQTGKGRPELDLYTEVAHVLFNSPEFVYVR